MSDYKYLSEKHGDDDAVMRMIDDVNNTKNANELLDVIFKLEIEPAIVDANEHRKEWLMFIGNKIYEINNKNPFS